MFGANGETVRGVLQVFNELDVKDKTVVSINGKEDEWAMDEARQRSRQRPQPAFSERRPVRAADRQVLARVETFEKYLQIKPFAVMTKDNLGEAIPWDTSNYMKGRAANTFK